jgi:hypothetical protein
LTHPLLRDAMQSSLGGLVPCAVGCREGGEGRERLTTHDALSYLRDVKLKFASNRRVYDR